MAVVRNCICCGKEYEYCPNCSKRNEPAWMVSFHSEQCKELFNIVSGYNMGLINKEGVRAFVAGHGIKNFNNYENSIRKILEETCVETPVVDLRNAEEEPKMRLKFRRKKRR